ncbi:MAG: fumarylacetoacetate hydrolase family protein [Mycobacterium sp.]
MIIGAGGPIDIHRASGGEFGPSMTSVLDRWDSFQSWCEAATPAAAVEPVLDSEPQLGPPVCEPRQIFAVGLNYADHAIEAKLATPTSPLIFAKFPSSLCGPDEEVELPEGNVDWEIELVVVIGVTGYRIPLERALDHVAGVMIGQDLSERKGQMRGAPAQFSLAKSHRRFAPTGPYFVTLDEAGPLDSLRLESSLNGEVVQSGTTAELIFSVPEIVAHISQTATLMPGDLIFTGTPAGVGMGRTPPRFLSAGDVLVSKIERLGEMTQRFVSRSNEFASQVDSAAAPA